jgi:hypothetical protein
MQIWKQGCVLTEVGNLVWVAPADACKGVTILSAEAHCIDSAAPPGPVDGKPVALGRCPVARSTAVLGKPSAAAHTQWDMCMASMPSEHGNRKE